MNCCENKHLSICQFASYMKTIDYRPAILCFIIAFILTVYGFENPASCREKSIIIIEVKENQGIRDISKKYFDDPDRWEDILRANDLKSPDEIKPGMLLRIPAGVFLSGKARTGGFTKTNTEGNHGRCKNLCSNNHCQSDTTKRYRSCKEEIR